MHDIKTEEVISKLRIYTDYHERLWRDKGGINPHYDIRRAIDLIKDLKKEQKEILDWFYGRVGDHLPNVHYQRLKEELEDMLGVEE